MSEEPDLVPLDISCIRPAAFFDTRFDSNADISSKSGRIVTIADSDGTKSYFTALV